MNVILVTVDSLRADALRSDWLPDTDGTHAPQLSALAKRGTKFENAFASGNWTPFSFPGILGSRSVFADAGDIGLAATPSLAEALGQSEIRTGGFNAANGFLTRYWGYDRGFDRFESFVSGDGGRYSKYLAAHPTVQGWLQLVTSPFRRAVGRFRGADWAGPVADTSRLRDVERGAKRFIRDSSEPFFLWVHYMDTHTPYVPAPRHLREVAIGQIDAIKTLRAHLRTGLGYDVDDRTLATLRTLYAGTIRQVDKSISRLQGVLADAGVADETCLVVAGDHGEEFLDHGHLAHYPKLYDELIHVPLLIAHPDGSPNTVDSHVGLDVVAPTVCELMNVDPLTAWEGDSVLGTVLGDASPPAEPVISVAVRGASITQQPIPRRPADGSMLVSARTQRWVYIENIATGNRELYHRPTDPTQRWNRYEHGPIPTGVPDRLAGAVETHARQLIQDGSAGEDVSPEIATRLKALGYR